MRARFARVSLVAILLVFAAPLVANDQAQILADIASTTHTDQETAVQVINAIVAFMHDLQSRFSYIASSTDAVTTKDNVARNTIQSCFVSDRSEIQVGSAYTRRIRTQPVNVYLYRLGRLRQLYGYTDVELYFRPKYLGIGRVYAIDGRPGTYEVSVSVVQIFKAWKYEQPVYTDATTKKFRVRFELTSDDILVTVDEVLVTETLANPDLKSEN